MQPSPVVVLVAVASGPRDSTAADRSGVAIGRIPAGTEAVIVAADDAVLAAPLLAGVRAGGWRAAVYLDEHLAEHLAEHLGAGAAVPPALAEFCAEVFGGQPVVVAAA